MIALAELYHWLLLLLGLPVVIEALALFLGMNIFVSEPVDWVTWKNNYFLGLDLFTGLGLLFMALGKKDVTRSPLFFGLLAVIFLGHLYRELEGFTLQPLKFCHTHPLLLVNTMKLSLSVGCLSLGLFLVSGS